MCTIAILIDVVDSVPIVVGANRDELYARPTRGPERLAPGIAGGVDVLSGGTWLAVNANGRFAAVTNQIALSVPPPGLRSRGLAVVELAAADDPDGYVAALDPTRYASMNLLWRGPTGISIAYTRREQGTIEIERLDRGVHVLCNDRLRAPGFPRCERLLGTIERALADDPTWPALIEPLASALADHTRVPVEEVPPSHLAPELARELTANCIHSADYGTRSSALLALADDHVIDYRHAFGPPCAAPFVSRMDLLR